MYGVCVGGDLKEALFRSFTHSIVALLASSKKNLTMIGLSKGFEELSK